MEISVDFTRFRSFLKIEQKDGKRYVFDPIRNKHIVLTPEEFVRQLVVNYLVEEKNYNKNRLGIEKAIKVNKQLKRCDIIVFNQMVKPWLIVECKSPDVKINQATFDQIATYNYALKVPYLVVTNGIQTYCCKIDWDQKSFEFIDQIPDYLDNSL